MATNPNYGAPLSGDAAFDAAQPLVDTPRGGVETSINGISGLTDTMAVAAAEPQQQLAGMGPDLEDSDEDVFKRTHALVLRQERLARNRLAIDTHWTRVKLGYPWSRLEKVQDQDVWRAVLPPGTASLSPAAVPNKAADLCNKIVEMLMQDPPQPSPEAENDSEEAERAAEMAEEFLTQDGGEKGTRDSLLFWNALDAATARSASFLHLWVDPSGGGYVPLQIKAHPTAQSPAQPMLGADGAPTTDPILRYITNADPAQAQFTTDPSQAPPQWLPRIRADLWNREHVRTFPETADCGDAQTIIGIFYSTLGEGKRRFPETCGKLGDADLASLCDWTPPRYIQLLPPALRARWKLQTGDAKDPAGSSNDERLFFYYVVYRRASQVYPRGSAVYVSGAFGGYIIDRDINAASVPHPEGGTDVRCMDMPVVQISLISDPDDRDPLDKPVIERFGGAHEAASTLATSYLEAIDILLHPARYTTATSPVEGSDVDESRATGKHIQVLSSADYPKYEEPRPLPPNFLETIEWAHEQMNGISGLSKPAQGSDSQQEVSGVARQIAVSQAKIAMTRFQQRFLSACERWYRIKLQLVMKYFSVPQQIRYVGEDGAAKQEWFSGVDFALVSNVGIQSGTGTMMPPQEKVNYINSLQQMQLMQPSEAADAARSTFTKLLGVPDDPHQQRIERQVSSWLKGPPSPEWIQQYQQYQVQQQQYAAVQQAAQAAAAAHQQASQAASDALHPQPAPAPPQLPPPPTPPWTPFAILPCDSEPQIASLRMRRLSKEMASARFSAQPPEWQSVLFDAYNQATQAVQSAQPTPPLPKGVTLAMSGDQSNVAQEEAAATHPAPPQPAPQAPAAPQADPRELLTHLASIAHAMKPQIDVHNHLPQHSGHDVVRDAHGNITGTRPAA